MRLFLYVVVCLRRLNEPGVTCLDMGEHWASKQTSKQRSDGEAVVAFYNIFVIREKRERSSPLTQITHPSYPHLG